MAIKRIQLPGGETLDINDARIPGIDITPSDKHDGYLATSDYVSIVSDLKVDKEQGKGLSENDFTDSLKEKLDTLQSHYYFQSDVIVTYDYDAESIGFTGGNAQYKAENEEITF